MKKLPVHIITGFLGAGKTTAILQLFSQKKNDELWAVVVNEFGKISIDSQTLGSNTPVGNIFDISGGCICCTAKGYLNESLEEIIQTGLYSRIIIEPSGLGGVDMVSEIVQTKPVLTLKPVVCMVDIATLEIPRLQLNPVYQRQIFKSDLVVFSKTDLIDNQLKLSELIQRFSANFPHAQVYEKFSNEISLSDIESLQNEQKIPSAHFSMFDPALSATNYLQKNCIFDADTVFEPDKLIHFLSENSSIIRAKGYVRTRDGWKLMNYTLSGCSFENWYDCSQNEIVIIADKSATSFFENMESELRKAIFYVSV